VSTGTKGGGLTTPCALIFLFLAQACTRLQFAGKESRSRVFATDLLESWKGEQRTYNAPG
jgi:hypothetical protein